ncbi:MAG: hypothetical protein ACI4NO_07100 [Oxalobacter sp.]
MKKYLALALIALGMVSMTGCRHHHRPDHDRPDYRNGNSRNSPQNHGRYDSNRDSQRSGSYGQHHGGPGNR